MTEVVEHVLTDWRCLCCGMVTPGGQPDPYSCCDEPFVLRVRAVQAAPAITEEPQA